MNIRMYNCYFGDCFNLLNENGNNLLVDFGIHESCTDKTTREKRFKDVYSDIRKQKADFLLSHYHEDHYNGVVYVCDSENYNFRFKDIYIPDIWQVNGCIKAIEIHLLRAILDGSILNKTTTIFDFLIAICEKNSTIHFVKRGTLIQKEYVALWPSDEFINEEAEKVISKALDVTGVDEEAETKLREFSERLHHIVAHDMFSRDYKGDYLLGQLRDLKEDLVGFAEQRKPRDKDSNVLVRLRKFENDISIVFQNIEDDPSENLLFTGDFGRKAKLWNQIENNTVWPKCDMHSMYHVIKVGHHGTRPYYHSFVGRMSNESILLIPNDGAKMRWNICSDYSLNAITTGAGVVCSTDNACEAKNCNTGQCTCTNRSIIGNNVFIDIT